MTNITLSIPNEVHFKMKMHMGKLEEKGSEMTTKELLQKLGDDFRKNLNELSFEKAEKKYKNMSDAEWKRVSSIQTG